MATTTESFWEPTPPGSIPSIPTTDDSTESLPTMTAIDDTPSSNIPVVESNVALDSSNDNDDPSNNSCLQESWNAKIMIPEDPPAPHIPPVGTEPPGRTNLIRPFFSSSPPLPVCTIADATRNN